MKISSILLPALVAPFIMNYALGPKDTPFWLFGLIFLLMLLYLSLDLITLKESIYGKTKDILLWLIIVSVIGSATVSAIIVRQQTAPIYGVHDIILQLESAIQAFLAGKNPYAITYFGTPLEQWHYSTTEINPALYHFVMPPFYLLFSLLFYFISITFFGFFDARTSLVLLFFLHLIIGSMMVKNRERRHIFLTLLAFNPATLGYFLEGRDDIFMFAFLMVGLFLLQKKHLALAGIFMALAFATKQSAWPLFPFYFAFLFFNQINSRNLGHLIPGIVNVIKNLLPFAVTFGLIVLPFFFWNSQAFLDSTIFYLSGNTAQSYPISGYGLGSLLRQWGFIIDKFAYYPFWIWQTFIGLPLMFILVLWQKKENSPQRLIVAYGIFLLVFWYLSRYFNNSHLGYLSTIFITGWAIGEHDKEI